MKHQSRTDLPTEPVSHDPQISKTVYLRAGDVPGLAQLAESSVEPGAETRPHSHQGMTEIFLVTGGVGKAVVDGCGVDLAPGSCLVVEPGESHAISNTGTQPLLLTYFGITPGADA